MNYTEKLFIKLVNEEHKFSTSKEGKIYSNKTKKEIGHLDHGYYRITHTENKKMYQIKIHRLVYLLYKGEIKKGCIVNHIDGNKLNNHIDNLESITYSKNIDHAYKIGLIKKRGKKIKNTEEIPEINKPKTKITEITGKYEQKEKYMLQLVYDGILRFTEDGEKIIRHDTNNLLGNVIRNGYKYVNFKNYTMLVHRLIYLIFIGPLGDERVNHKDGNKLNNHKDNLEITTNAKNIQHAYDTGLASRGEKHYNSKLSENDVIEIRENIHNYSHSKLAKIYGVGRPAIGDIINHKRWKHI